MEIRRCEKGHFYDAEANSSCPQCAAEQQAGGFGETQPGFEAEMPQDYGATEPLEGFSSEGEVGETQPLTQGHGFENGGFGSFASGVEDYDSVTQPVTLGGIAGFAPVVGWLVCTEGPARGTDYRIRAGYNYIGRSEHMDICVKGDLKIGRERHALVAYDPEEKVFFFGPADGKSIVRLNGKMVMAPMEIHAYDVLTLGSTRLLFIPLCGERFDWNE